MKTKLFAVLMTLLLMVPAESALARHHYSQARGAVIGGVAGALIGHGVKGALIGAAVGTGVQYARNQHERNKVQHVTVRRHHRRHHR
jgi:uncharacterized protein YcfJ